MKAEAWIFWVLVAFFAIVTPAYWFIAYEVIGLVALGLTGALSLMIAVFLSITARKIDARPEDLKTAEVADGAGTVGFFPPRSIWPFWVALTLAVMVLGPIFGWWLTILGAGMGIWSLSGWIYEYYRGEYAH